MPSSPGQRRNSGHRLVDKVGREMLAGLATIPATPAVPAAHFKLGTSQQGNQVCTSSKMLLSHSNRVDSPVVGREPWVSIFCRSYTNSWSHSKSASQHHFGGLIPQDSAKFHIRHQESFARLPSWNRSLSSPHRHKT